MDLTLNLIIEKVFQIQKKKEIFKSFNKITREPLVIDKVTINTHSSKFRTREDLDSFKYRL